MEEDIILKIKDEIDYNIIIESLTQIIKDITSNSHKLDNTIIEEITLIFLNSDNDLVRMKATELAEYTKSELILEKITYLLINDSNYYVRGFSAKVLGSIGNLKSKDVLEQALNDSEGFVIAFVTQALKTINIKLSFSSKLDMLKAKLQTIKQS